MATTAEMETPTSVGLNRLAKYGLFAVVAASVANAVVRVIALAVFDVPVDLPAKFDPLGWGPVIGGSAIAAIVAAIVYGVITRYSTRPNRTFTIVSVVVLLLSLLGFVGPPPVLAGASSSLFATLIVMHVVAAAVIVGVLTRATSNAEMAKESP